MPRKPRDLENYMTPRRAAAFLREQASILLHHAEIEKRDLIKIRIEKTEVLKLWIWRPTWREKKDAKES